MATTTVRVGQYAAGIGIAGVALFVLGLGIVHAAAGVVQAPLALLSGGCLVAAAALAPARGRGTLADRMGIRVDAWRWLGLLVAAGTLFGLFLGVAAL